MSTAITKLLWGFSKQYEDSYNIGNLCENIGKECNLDQDEINELRQYMYQGLKEMTDEIYVEGNEVEGAEYGYCEELDCYWVNTNAYFEWYPDKPEWWEEMLEKQHEEVL